MEQEKEGHVAENGRRREKGAVHAGNVSRTVYEERVKFTLPESRGKPSR